jgi:hypothetical protein
MPSLCLVSVMPATALMVLADSVRLSSSRKPGMAEMREMHLQILGYRKAWLRRRALFCRLRGCYLRHRLRRRGGIHVMATACPSSARLSGPNGPHNPRRLCPGRKPNPAGTSVGTTLIGTAIVSVGSWSLDTNLAAGSYISLNVVATDLAGNSTTRSTPRPSSSTRPTRPFRRSRPQRLESTPAVMAI